MQDRKRGRTSKRGRMARKAVKIANHLSVPGHKVQAGTLRSALAEREKLWECPEHLLNNVIDMGDFIMEFLEVNENAVVLINGEEKTFEKGHGAILHLHGGGYYGMLHNTYRDMAALYVEASGGMSVLSVDYRVAPENPYPAALNDAISAYKWLLDSGFEGEDIIIAGDSAGGGLSLALSLYLKDNEMPMPAGIITMSAWTDLTAQGQSYKDNYDIDPMFGRNPDSLIYHNAYYENDDPKNPYISPIFGNYEGFPPMLMQVGEYEMLLSDTLTVAKKAKEAGVMIKEHVYKGMFHDFQMGLLMYPESKEAWVEIRRFISTVKKGASDV